MSRQAAPSDQASPALRIREMLCALDPDWLVAVAMSGLEACLPDSLPGHRVLLATREEEAIHIAAGMSLAGTRAAVLMQQSGVGNCLNAVFSLVEPYGLEVPVFVLDRGLEDNNPVQRASSRRTRQLLEGLGLIACPSAERVEAGPSSWRLVS